MSFLGALPFRDGIFLMNRYIVRERQTHNQTMGTMRNKMGSFWGSVKKRKINKITYKATNKRPFGMCSSLSFMSPSHPRSIRPNYV